jgi:hypothetical protein
MASPKIEALARYAVRETPNSDKIKPRDPKYRENMVTLFINPATVMVFAREADRFAEIYFFPNLSTPSTIKCTVNAIASMRITV